MTHAPGVPSLAGQAELGPALVSYAQNAEDVRLWRVLAGVEHGFYVDVGAADPSIGSVTRLFYERGWRGINVEPSPVFDSLAAARQRDVNLRALVGEASGTVDFYLTYPDLGLSTTDLAAHAHVPHAVERVECVQLPQVRLDSLLDEHAHDRPVHFLKVDVEGAEQAVLASNDWARHRPWIVLVESVRSWDSSPTYHEWEPPLLEAGYHFAAFDGINRFYVAREHADLAEGLSYPISPLDHFVTSEHHDTQTALSTTTNELAALKADVRRLGVSVHLLDRLRSTLWLRHRALQAAEHQQAALAEELAHANDRIAALDAEVTHLHATLDAVHTSRTWQAGRAAWYVARPAVRLARKLGAPASAPIVTGEVASGTTDAIGARRDPAAACAAAVQPGAVWAFAANLRVDDPRFDAVEALLAVEAHDHEAVATALHQARADVADRDTWTPAGRRALAEAEAALLLPAERSDTSPGGGHRIVVDARALQDPHLRDRGVGKQVLQVIAALRAAAGDRPLVLLTAPGAPPLDRAVVAPGDAVVTSPHEVAAGDVGLLVSLSTMTASPAPVVPYLLSPSTTCVALVFDFIPARWPDQYLVEPATRVEYAARLRALRNHDRAICISATTAVDAQAVLGWSDERLAVSGVADPLGRAGTSSGGTQRYAIVPSGGDPRKNLLAAVAAVALHRRATGDELGVVCVGHLDARQRQAAEDLAGDVGLPEGSLQFRSGVSASELDSLYRHAAVAVVPSFDEGFSIPVAEAVRRGVPVVASDIPVHRELVGDGWWLVAPTDVVALGHALTTALAEAHELRVRQREALGDLADPAAVHDRLRAVLDPLVASLPPAPSGAGRRSRPPADRPRVAIASPYPPTPSGVADYTAFTVEHLRHLADVVVCSTEPAQGPPPDGVRVQLLEAGVHLDRDVDAVLSVAGNSLLHVPVLELLASFGGACLAHDNRMAEMYAAWLGDEAAAELLSTPHRAVVAAELPGFFADLDTLPNLGYGPIAAVAQPLVVHSHELADRITAETGRPVGVVPFAPYNLPRLDHIDAEARARARRTCALDSSHLHVATFGMVDQRTKGADVLLDALAWLRSWGEPVTLHLVGPVHPRERHELLALADRTGISADLRFHGRVDRATFETWLLAVDVAVQLRTSTLLSLSGAVADCIVHGTPTITNGRIADEMGAPSFVWRVPDKVSGLVLAETIVAHRDAGAIVVSPDHEHERRQYIAEHSGHRYAAGLLAALDLGGSFP